MKINVYHTIEQCTMTHPLTTGIHESEHACAELRRIFLTYGVN